MSPIIPHQESRVNFVIIFYIYWLFSHPHQDTLYQINYCHPPSSSHVTPSADPIPVNHQTPFQTLLKFISRQPHQKFPSVILTRAPTNFTIPHHLVSPEHQSVHHTPSVSFTRASSYLRDVFRFLIIKKLLSYIYHIINKKSFILLYTYLWFKVLCL